MQKILKEHQQQMHALEKDKREMDEQRQKQHQEQEGEARKKSVESAMQDQLPARAETEQSIAPPPSPNVLMSPAGSVHHIDQPPVASVARPSPARAKSAGSPQKDPEVHGKEPGPKSPRPLTVGGNITGPSPRRERQRAEKTGSVEQGQSGGAAIKIPDEGDKPGED